MPLPVSFWRGAAAGVFLSTVGLAALAGAFFGAGVSTVVEVAVFLAGGVVVFLASSAAARRILRAGRLVPEEAIVLFAAALTTLVLLPLAGFRWPESLYYPAVSIFVLAQAALAGVVWTWLRGSSGRALVAIAIVAVAIDVLGVLFLVGEGNDPFPVEPPATGPQGAPVDLPNPSARGGYGVRAFTYGSGTDRRRPEFGSSVDWKSETVDASKLLPEWRGFKKRMREWYWGFSLAEAPLNGRVWAPEGNGPFALVLVLHGNHRMEEYSDPGYAYLGELLASRGFLTVSVDENYVNGTWSGDFRGKEMPLRAWLLLQHLSQWRKWASTAGHEMEGKVDLSKVALIGHSRGGEAVAIAGAFNRLSRHPDDAAIRFDFGFGIRGLVAIAQTDVRYSRRIELEDVNFLALQGSYDSDEASFFGLRQLRRIDFGEDGYFFKAGVYIHGANHGQFNTAWGRTDASAPYSWLLNLEPILSGPDQRRIAEVYISAFLEAVLHDERAYVALFRDPGVGRDWLPRATLVPRFADSTLVTVADFEEDIDVTTTTLPGGTIETSNLALWREEELLFRDDQKQGTSAVVLGVEASAEARYRLRFAPPAGHVSHVTFSMSQSMERVKEKEKEAHEGPGAPPAPEVFVEIGDDSGGMAEIPLRDVAPMAVPLRVRFLKLARWSRRALGREWEPTLRSYEIPVAAFMDGNAELDPTRLSTIGFRFRAPDGGVVLLDDVSFRRKP